MFKRLGLVLGLTAATANALSIAESTDGTSDAAAVDTYPSTEEDAWEVLDSLDQVYLDFEALLDELELYEDDGEEWTQAVKDELPYILNDMAKGLKELNQVEKKKLIKDEDIWNLITLDDFKEVLLMMTELGITQSQLKTAFAKNGNDPAEADLIQFFMGYSIDGSKSYAWVNYTEDDWDNLDDKIYDDFMEEYEDFDSDDEDDDDDDDWMKDFDTDVDWDNYDWDSWDDEDLDFEDSFLSQISSDLSCSHLFAQKSKKDDSSNKQQDLDSQLAEVSHDILVIQPPFTPVEEGKKKKKKKSK